MEVFMNDFHEAIEYLDKIDDAYVKGKFHGLSRYSIEWGTFSREMNLEIRKKIESGHPEKLFLKMVMPYWINRSVMLEIYHEKKNKIRKNRLRSLSKECERIRNDISTGRAKEADMPTMMDIARMSMQGSTL